MPTRKSCPRCKSTNTARSHRRFYERLIPGLVAFRCDDCKHRFFHHGKIPIRVQQG